MAEEKWRTRAKGVYFTSCLTQSVFLSPNTILTAGTDGHVVLWPLASFLDPKSLAWKEPARIHQNASKTLTTHQIDGTATLVVSGGDDGTLAFIVVRNSSTSDTSAAVALDRSYASPPIILTRAHASAVTSCAVLTHQSRILLL